MEGNEKIIASNSLAFYLLFCSIVTHAWRQSGHSSYNKTGMHLERSNDLKRWKFRHYLRTQSQGHHIIDRLEERGTSWKGRAVSGVSQTWNGTISEATWRNLLAIKWNVWVPCAYMPSSDAVNSADISRVRLASLFSCPKNWLPWSK